MFRQRRVFFLGDSGKRLGMKKGKYLQTKKKKKQRIKPQEKKEQEEKRDDEDYKIENVFLNK